MIQVRCGLVGRSRSSVAGVRATGEQRQRKICRKALVKFEVGDVHGDQDTHASALNSYSIRLVTSVESSRDSSIQDLSSIRLSNFLEVSQLGA